MWPSLRTALSWQMIPRNLRNICTTRNNCRDALPCGNIALKLPPIFTCWWRSLLVATSKFGLLTIRQYGATRKHQTVSSRWQVRSEKAKKWEASTLTPAIISVHLPKPFSTDLTIKPDSVLTNLIRKDGVQSWLMLNIYPIRHFYRDTITRNVANQG